MLFFKKAVVILCIGTSLYANDGVGSEMSHLIGGVAAAGAVTYAVDAWWLEYAEDRGWIGFWVSSGVIAIEQFVEYKQHGDAQGQALDTAAHILGSAIGAYVTDKYLLSPIVKENLNGDKTYGVQLTKTF